MGLIHFNKIGKDLGFFKCHFFYYYYPSGTTARVKHLCFPSFLLQLIYSQDNASPGREHYPVPERLPHASEAGRASAGCRGKPLKALLSFLLAAPGSSSSERADMLEITSHHTLLKGGNYLVLFLHYGLEKLYLPWSLQPSGEEGLAEEINTNQYIC